MSSLLYYIQKVNTMLNPFIDLISAAIGIVNFILLAWVILSILMQFKIVNGYNPLVRRIFDALSQIVDPALKPLRKLQYRYLPNVTAVDLSPIALILILHFVRSALYHWFYSI